MVDLKSTIIFLKCLEKVFASITFYLLERAGLLRVSLIAGMEYGMEQWNGLRNGRSKLENAIS